MKIRLHTLAFLALVWGCGSQEETIDRRSPGLDIPIGPSEGEPQQPATAQFLKGHENSLIECLSDEFQATQCRLLKNPSVLSPATEKPQRYEVNYEFNCSSGQFDSGLKLKVDPNSELSVSLITDSKESITVEGLGPLVIEASDPEAFAGEIFNLGCHLLVTVTKQ